MRTTKCLYALILLTALPVAADPCTDIISDTIAEMRAGADGWWTDEVEGLVRVAAGSACVKARSGRYGMDAGGAEPAAGTTAVAERVPVVEQSGEEAGEGTASDDGSWSVGGLTFRGLNGSPGSKPYQRQRKTDEEG